MTLNGVSDACQFGQHPRCTGMTRSYGVPCGCGCHALGREPLQAVLRQGTATPATPVEARTMADGDHAIRHFLVDLLAEFNRARATHGTYASHHEAYAVLLEEVQEYWHWVTRRDSERDAAAMYRELVQVAQVAMAAAVLLVPPQDEGETSREDGE